MMAKIRLFKSDYTSLIMDFNKYMTPLQQLLRSKSNQNDYYILVWQVRLFLKSLFWLIRMKNSNKNMYQN